MRNSILAAALTSVVLCGAALAATPAVPTYVTASIGDAARPEADTARDVNRKPADVLAFAGLKPGDKIVELQPGRGYYTRLLCKVVGASGHIHAVSFMPNMAARGPAPPDAPRAAGPAGGQGGGQGGGRQGGGAAAPAGPSAAETCGNVTASSVSGASFALPASGLDLVWTSENYHDFHLEMMGLPSMQVFNKAVFDALKPGGVFIVEDHAAAAGSGTRDTDALHRIDPATVIQEVTSAGFVLDSRSNVLAVAGDDHTQRVFALAGKTDKFLLKFRKPAR